jgi:ABC-2 type transport system permease protein
MRSSRLARFEWQLLASDRTPWLMVLLFGAMMLYGAWNGVAWTRFQNGTIADVSTEESVRLEKVQDAVQRRAAGDSTASVAPIGALGAAGAVRYAILPPTSLAPLAVGSSDLFPYYTKVSLRSKQSFVVNDEIENPHNLLAGRFDLAFAIVFVLPLLILALTYNLVSSEREQGTMALILSQPVMVRRVLLLKLAVRVGFALGLTLLLTLGVVIAAGIPLTAPGTIPKLLLWMAVVVVYSAFWIAAAIAVNALGRSSATNALALLGVWLTVVVIVPSLVAAVVTTFYPAPSRVALITELRRVSDQAAAQGDTAVSQFLADHPEMAQLGALSSRNAWGRTIALQERTEDAMRPTYAAFDAALEAQRTAADRLRILSPAILVQDALHDIAGRSVTRYRHYAAQVDTFHQRWQQYFFRRVFAEATMTPADFEALPRFAYAEESVTAVSRRVGVAVLLVLLPAVLLAWWGATRLRVVSLAER